MLNLLGEYQCKCDAKGRIMFPAGLRKQLKEVVHEGFVINRDMFSKCLVLYPMQQWSEVSAQVGRLNRFVAKNVQFIRRFNNGATRAELDSAGRLLLPPALTSFAGVTKEVRLLALGDRVEIWSQEAYDEMVNEDVDMAALSEDVMGGINPDGDAK